MRESHHLHDLVFPSSIYFYFSLSLSRTSLRTNFFRNSNPYLNHNSENYAYLIDMIKLWKRKRKRN
jgi:hypothetical protein